MVYNTEKFIYFLVYKVLKMAIIVSNLEELEREFGEQFPNGRHFPELFAYLRSLSDPEKREKLESLKLDEDPNKFPIVGGTDYIIGKDVYAVEKRYKPKPRGDRFWETHLKEVDIQVIISGEQIIESTSLDGLTLLPAKSHKIKWWTGEYNEENDVSIYSNDKKGISNHMKPGMIGVFLPKDAHMPEVEDGGPETGIKVVVKYPVAFLNR